MTRKLSRRTVLATGTAAAIAMPSIARAQVQGVSATEIVVGSHIDLSGPVAADMPKLRAGIQLRLDEANDRGGVNGRKFRLIVEDNGSQPQMGVRAATKLIQQDQVFAIINAFGSGPNAATIKRAVDANVIVFAPWGASAIFQKIAGGSPLLITTVPNYDTAMAAGLTWAIDTFKSAKVGFIYQEGPFGDLIGAGVKKALATKNLSAVAEASYKPGDIDFSSHVARMKGAGADLIVTATLTRETVGVVSETKKIGWTDVKVLTATPGRTANVTRLGGAAVEGLYGVGSWNVLGADTTNAEAKAFFANLKSKHNFDPDENALLAYAYADIFVRAVEAAGKDVTPQTVAAALGTMKSTNPIFYDEKSFKSGHMVPETVRIEQVKGGLWTPVSGLLQ
jgi:branched-chain amino acid transport system substrate-binding protein